jgi:hypothetical protein
MSRKITSEREARNRRWGFGQECVDGGSGFVSTDKPAATGGGTHDRECPIWVGGRCKCSSYVPTPPASQPTVTLDRSKYEAGIEALEGIKRATDERSLLRLARINDICNDALALLRAAEQK